MHSFVSNSISFSPIKPNVEIQISIRIIYHKNLCSFTSENSISERLFLFNRDNYKLNTCFKQKTLRLAKKILNKKQTDSLLYEQSIGNL